jgi:hypothetical protein
MWSRDLYKHPAATNTAAVTATNIPTTKKSPTRHVLGVSSPWRPVACRRCSGGSSAGAFFTYGVTCPFVCSTLSAGGWAVGGGLQSQVSTHNPVKQGVSTTYHCQDLVLDALGPLRGERRLLGSGDGFPCLRALLGHARLVRRPVRLAEMLQAVLVLSQEQDLAGLHAHDYGQDSRKHNVSPGPHIVIGGGRSIPIHYTHYSTINEVLTCWRDMMGAKVTGVIRFPWLSRRTLVRGSLTYFIATRRPLASSTPSNTRPKESSPIFLPTTYSVSSSETILPFESFAQSSLWWHASVLGSFATSCSSFTWAGEKPLASGGPTGPLERTVHRPPSRVSRILLLASLRGAQKHNPLFAIA